MTLEEALTLNLTNLTKEERYEIEKEIMIPIDTSFDYTFEEYCKRCAHTQEEGAYDW